MQSRLILDRVLHMLAAEARIPMLGTAMGAVTPEVHLLVEHRPDVGPPVNPIMKRFRQPACRRTSTSGERR